MRIDQFRRRNQIIRVELATKHMDIEGSDGSKTLLEPGSTVECGRGLGLKSNDRTVSRRHVAFELAPSNEPNRVRFQVIGKNPVWVHSGERGKVSTFRTCERGEMEIGDMFCVSAKTPVWFTVRKADSVVDNFKRELDFEGRCEVRDFDALEPESIDISHIDPVKEFGVLVIGEEFDGYPRKMIRDFKNWDWFLEEPGEESEDDGFDINKRRKSGRRKRKKDGQNEDEDWGGESEEEKELLTEATKVQKAKYSTRSKDRDKRAKDTGKGTTSKLKYRKRAEEEDIDEEEDDETLGGFIVDNDQLEEAGEEIDEEEEEEEFEEDEDEEEVED